MSAVGDYVSDAVQATMADHGVRLEEAARAAGMSAGTLQRRLADGSAFTFTELDLLAEFLGVHPMNFQPI